MQNLIKELRSPRLRVDDSSEPPTATCLRAANALEKLNEMGRADLAVRQIAERKLIDIHVELDSTRAKYLDLVHQLDVLRAKYENETTNTNSEGITSDISVTDPTSDGTSDTQL